MALDADVSVPPAPGLDALVDRLGVGDDVALLGQACAHRSWCAEHPGYASNERLEFLGDSVLGFVIADAVFRAEPGLDEGALTDVRKAVVNAVCLAEVAADVDLGAHLLLGRGEEHSGGREKPSILSDALEAVLGAVYLDLGLDAVTEVVDRLLGARMRVAIEAGGRGQDHKSRLQELLAARGCTAPRYEFTSTGPDHARSFSVTVTVDGAELGLGSGRSKKQAEQHAARATVAMLEHRGADGATDTPGGDLGG